MRTVLSLAFLALLSGPATSQQPAPTASLLDTLFADLDGSGGPSCGDVVQYNAFLNGNTPVPLEGTRFELTIPANASLDPTTLVVNNPNPQGGPVVVLSGDEPGDTLIQVDLGRICPLGACASPPFGATVSWRVSIVDPNPSSVLTLQGTLSGSNFSPILTDDLAVPGPTNPTSLEYAPCPGPPPTVQVSALLTDALHLDADGDGLVDQGEVVRYTAQFRTLTPTSGLLTSFLSDVDLASSLNVGTVTTTQGAVAEGNNPGDTRVRVAVGSLTVNLVTVRFDVTVDDPVPAAVSQLSVQGTVSGFNFLPVLTDDPAAPGPADPTVTPLDFDPDLALAKSDGGASAVPGGVVPYTLAASNVSTRQGATGARLTDTVPAHSTFEAAASSPGWTCTPGPAAGSVCTLNVGTLGPGASASRTFAVRVGNPVPPGVTQIANTAAVADDGSAGPDPNPANNTSSDTTPLAAGATVPDLSLAKTDGGISATPGDVVVYTLAWTNSGTQGATGVVLTDTVPAHASFDPGASSPGWTCAGSTCTRAVGTVAGGGASGSALFAVSVADPVPAGVASILNTATVADDGANGPDPTPANNTATDTTPLDPATTRPDLVLGKSDGGATAQPGSVVVYTLTYTNAGNRGASGVEITDTVPEHATFSASGSTAGWVCTPGPGAGSTCRLPRGTLAGGGAGGSAVFAVVVDDPLPAGVTEIVNLAAIGDDGANGADGNPADNSAGDSTPIVGGAPNLVLTKTLDPASGPVPGGVLLWRLFYANTGNQGASGVSLTDEVPQHTSFHSPGSSPGWLCDPGPGAGSTCTLQVGDLPAGTSGTALFAVLIDDPLPPGVSSIENCGELDDEGGPVAGEPAESCASVGIPGARPDLAIEKSDGGVTVPPGGEVAYLLTYSNLGNQGATGVEIRDTVPAHTSFHAAGSTPGWACAPGTSAGAVCVLPIGTLLAGQSGSATFAVQVVDPVPVGVGQVVNTVLIDDDGENGPDADPGNNLASDTTPLEGGPPPLGPSVSAFKEDFLSGDGNGDGVASPGEHLTYVVTLAAAAATALDVLFASGVDPNTELLVGSVTTDHGVVTLGNGAGDTFVEVAVGTLAAGEVATVSFTVAISDPFPPNLDQVACQGQVSGTNFQVLLTDDPDTPELSDPTVTPVVQGFGPGGVLPIPTLGELGLFALASGLGAVALVAIRRRRQGREGARS